MTRQDLADRLTGVARDLTENGMVSVEYRGGVYRLVLSYADGRPARALGSVGLPKAGLRRLMAEVERLVGR